MSIKREVRDYLEDILQSVQDIREFVAGMDFPQFHSDRKTFHAVVRSLEIIGEAARKIPDEMRDRHPGLPWREMGAMRNKLIHECFGVDPEIVWETIQQDLNLLEGTVRDLLDQISV
ncbi:hypothetical protein DBW_1176 [Desulfuromonas sp. DDH964]|uniref:HepT-like ribonuclease domain-containing protein n=1 Tax=Desulfuromonas sp. DDH964 TaxID=1823759 RepID=UPI00078E96B4|nr:DUF86 domain-containing protein [Desulfuromonas sp. DDH964]AMV71550.1 hypothetical protein DBW_1176 [Desulfuromonas sp. DDH964]